MVALRYLWALKRRSFISVISAFSVVGVALGVASLIVVMGVMTGFTNDLRDKILGANAHILVFSHSGYINDYQDAMRIVREVPGVKGVTPFIYSESMLSANGAVKGLALRGIDPEGADKVLGIFKLLIEGSLSDLLPAEPKSGAAGTEGAADAALPPGVPGTSGTPGASGTPGETGADSSESSDKAQPVHQPRVNINQDGTASWHEKPQTVGKGSTGKPTPGIIIGKELAKRMSVRVGSRVSVLSPSGQKSAAGFNPRILPFNVVGIFSTGMFEYDTSMAFVSLDSARDILSVSGDSVFGLEIIVDDIYAAEKISREINLRLPTPLYSRHWMDMNANLFAALKLEKTAMGVILTFIVLVGSFSIITSLVMLVMEKKRDIAILMSMGATRQAIRKIFMLQGVIIGALGTVTGNIIGIGISFMVERYQFIKLPEGVYSTDHLTVLIEWQDIAIISVAAMLICFLATIYPARQAAGLQPVEALRQE